MAQTVIELYQCESCKRQVFEEDFKAGKGCKCGSLRVRRAAPTFKFKVGYILRNPKVILTWWKENVIRQG